MIYQIETTDEKIYIIESVNGIAKTIDTLGCNEWNIFYQLNNQEIALRESDIKRVIVLKQ
jgi:hypothetical protein